MSCRDVFTMVKDGEAGEIEGTVFKRKTVPRGASFDDLRAAADVPESFRRRRESGLSETGGDRFLDESPASWALPNSRAQTSGLTVNVHPPTARDAPLTPTGILSPNTARLLFSHGCELMSPCISVRSAGEREVVARPATIKDSEGIWIRLELTHSMQALLDSCGNGKLSWLCVAVRLDLANALSVNPRHLQLISMEERPENKVVLQLILTQPPESALSLAKVGEVLHEQTMAQASKARAWPLESETHCQSLNAGCFRAAWPFAAQQQGSPERTSAPGPVNLKKVRSCQSLAPTVPSMNEEVGPFQRAPSDPPSPSKRSPILVFACPPSLVHRASGEVLKNRKRVVNLLQLVEKVEVHPAALVLRSSASWRKGLYAALILLTLTSLTYFASAFGVFPASRPLRSSPSSSATNRDTHFAASTPAPFLLARAPRAALRTSAGVTRLRMLEPMTLATMVLMGASKLSGSVSHVAKRRWGKTLPSADATPGSEEERFLLLQRINKTPDVPVVHVSRGERKSQDRTELENRAKAPSAVPTNNAIHKTRDIISASTQTLDRLSSTTFLAAKSAAQLAKRRAKADKRRITRTVSSLQNESDEALLSKASEYMTEKLDNEMSVESMVVEDTMESMLDVLDKVVTKSGQHTTTLLHHSTSTLTHSNIGHSTTNILAKNAIAYGDQIHSASMMLQKAQFVDALSSAIHWTSSCSLGGITSVGVAVGLAFAMAVFDDAITRGGNMDV